MKPLFIVSTIFLFLLLLELFQVLRRIGNVSVFPSQQIYKQCSWLKQIPKNWSCSDNWDQDDRFIRAYSKESSLELHIYSPYVQIPKTKCDVKILVGLPHKPSASGIAVPLLCIYDKEKYFYADWEQDGYDFHFKGKNVSRYLFLDNLQRVGYNPFK